MARCVPNSFFMILHPSLFDIHVLLYFGSEVCDIGQLISLECSFWTFLTSRIPTQ